MNKYPNDPIGAILSSRGISDYNSFVNCDYKDLVNPLSVPNMSDALSRIYEAISAGKKIGVFMDYDADGIPGGTIVYKALRALGGEVVALVPKREDGYGLSEKAIEKFANLNVSLIITVDCGIKNVKEIAKAKKLGIDTIVTDHHELDDKLPDSINVHPLIEKNNNLRFRGFSGGGVAFLLAKALTKKSGQEKWFLDLAAISSIADMVPLRDDNRLIAKFGLVVLNKTKNIGLQELIKVSNLKLGQIGAYEVGYVIAPRINAAGRISHPEKSFKLFTCEDRVEAKALAIELNDLNAERQEALKQAQQEAEERVLSNKLFEQKIIILKSTKWLEGIIGLVAGKISQKFYRPTIIFSERNESLKGSARSIRGVNITDLIGKSEEYLLGYGGHEQAAGLSLESKKFQFFEKSIMKNAAQIADKLFKKTFTVDVLLEAKQVNITLARDLERLEPFGSGNPRPIFALEGVKVVGVRHVGRDEKHLKMEIEKSSYTHSVIAFFFENNGWDIKAGDMCDLAFSIKKGEFNGRDKLDLVVEDIRKKDEK